ncbi:hypothetical protein [Marinifilum flexuosum]|nr:hypothetical protein [Marinifilum flexuosum]
MWEPAEKDKGATARDKLAGTGFKMEGEDGGAAKAMLPMQKAKDGNS